jgi:hypothetical protein
MSTAIASTPAIDRVVAEAHGRPVGDAPMSGTVKLHCGMTLGTRRQVCAGRVYDAAQATIGTAMG